MSGKRIGERLSHMVPLSGHDIEEILSEQGTTGKRFGDIAIQLGLCSPQHIWRAWSSQLLESPQRVNLDEFGIDAQAVAHVPESLALRLHIMPIRVLGPELVVAVDESAYSLVRDQLAKTLKDPVIFVLCSHQQISRALRLYYSRCSAA
jgi:hypothetical protein